MKKFFVLFCELKEEYERATGEKYRSSEKECYNEKSEKKMKIIA
jgi:hypothetical protein